jgi:hypothetical protein
MCLDEFEIKMMLQTGIFWAVRRLNWTSGCQDPRLDSNMTNKTSIFFVDIHSYLTTVLFYIV